MGFSQLIHFDDKDISTEYSALMSKVMTERQRPDQVPDQRAGRPAKKSQIEEYLDFYGGPGVQHIALATDDIVATVRALREQRRRVPRGAARLLRDAAGPRRRRRRPDRHARGARHPGRPRRRGLPAPDLHQAGRGPPDALLRDHRAARLARLRRGNFKALFEAIEREQAKRGNL